ncbi:hypothetical protein [Arachidicoccus terrestris]|nr:hypothetical protein [Arachidicoccus terrestris]UAY55745.1 hypothetical protein K9M52_01545 [Arachidicoccus terrestris]
MEAISELKMRYFTISFDTHINTTTVFALKTGASRILPLPSNYGSSSTW